MRVRNSLMASAFCLVTIIGTAGAAESNAASSNTMPMSGSAASATPSTQDMIKSAMAAAPAAIAKDATIIVMGADGKMTTLRKGTNGFTCMPDDPTTPGPDPMCMDANSLEFVMALASHKAPPADKIGFMYMLVGGTDASNTDPYAKGPSPGNHWIKTGPHIMIVGTPVKTMMAGYPKSADPDTSKPYVMWAGTPYEHLMVPVGSAAAGQ